jgi:hypothetical protein
MALFFFFEYVAHMLCWVCFVEDTGAKVPDKKTSKLADKYSDLENDLRPWANVRASGKFLVTAAAASTAHASGDRDSDDQQAASVWEDAGDDTNDTDYKPGNGAGYESLSGDSSSSNSSADDADEKNTNGRGGGGHGDGRGATATTSRGRGSSTTTISARSHGATASKLRGVDTVRRSDNKTSATAPARSGGQGRGTKTSPKSSAGDLNRAENPADYVPRRHNAAVRKDTDRDVAEAAAKKSEDLTMLIFQQMGGMFERLGAMLEPTPTHRSRRDKHKKNRHDRSASTSSESSDDEDGRKRARDRGSARSRSRSPRRAARSRSRSPRRAASSRSRSPRRAASSRDRHRALPRSSSPQQ